MQTKRQEVLMKKMEIKEYLKNKGITFKEVTHQAVYTVEESKKLNIHDELKGIHSKNLFLKNRKGNKFYLIILPENKKLDLELFENKLNEKLKFANEEELKEILGLTRGAVTPFGLINDAESKVNIIIDKEILESDYVNFHPNVNTATLNLSKKDFQKYLSSLKNEVTIT